MPAGFVLSFGSCAVCFAYLALCRFEHELDSVELVYFGSTGIVIDGDDVGTGMCVPYCFDDTLADNMVGQACEGLAAYDVRNTVMDELDHLARKEPSFTCLISDGYDGLCKFCDLLDRCLRSEVITLFECLGAYTAQGTFNRPYAEIAISLCLLAHSELVSFIYLIVEAVEHEIHQVG